MRPHTASAPLAIELGDVEISFDPEYAQELTRIPAIKRDLLIAEALEKVEPDLGRYLKV